MVGIKVGTKNSYKVVIHKKHNSTIQRLQCLVAPNYKDLLKIFIKQVSKQSTTGVATLSMTQTFNFVPHT